MSTVSNIATKSDPVSSVTSAVVTPPTGVSTEPEEDECTICLDTVKTRGVINSCAHTFCYQCISKSQRAVKAVCNYNSRHLSLLCFIT